jgi:glycosyltransferase involved in cell wall biosynthesis
LPKLLFLVTEDWYFYSHRLPPARAAKAAGFEVVVATRVNRHGASIEAEGFKLVPIRLRRRSWNPFHELAAIAEIIRIYLRERPDVVHQVALKPTLYGSLAARIARVPAIVNALPGLGLVFSSRGRGTGLMRAVVVGLFRAVFNTRRAVMIVQNPEDAAIVSGRMVAADRVRLIRGSGVDIKRFCPTPEPDGVPVVMLASRMLWQKGIAEFVQAAQICKGRGMDARFVLLGDSDPENPASIPMGQLQAWRDSGVVEWPGRSEDMPQALAQASIVCLPSAYGEGVPKVLIEAAACGRSIVATDAPGCREIARHGENALLVPLRDAAALADAIAKLLADPALRSEMGRRGRSLVEAEFSQDLVAQQTLAIYREMLEGPTCPAVQVEPSGRSRERS